MHTAIIYPSVCSASVQYAGHYTLRTHIYCCRPMERLESTSSRTNTHRLLISVKLISDFHRHLLVWEIYFQLNSPIKIQMLNRVIQGARIYGSVYKVMGTFVRLVVGLPFRIWNPSVELLSRERTSERERVYRKQEKLINWQNQQNGDEKRAFIVADGHRRKERK